MTVTTKEAGSMTRVAAGITASLDGYITGPNDGPGRGLGDDGERLHYWVFGGPWSYQEEPRGEPTGADKEVLDEAFARVGAVVGGRNTYEAAEAWGGHNPFGSALHQMATASSSNATASRRVAGSSTASSSSWEPVG
jgi:hypothetical protein